MAETFFNSPVDPFNSDTIATAAYYHVQSVTKTGSFPDIIAPSGHNYPNTSPSRTFIELAMVIDQSDLTGTRPIIVTGSVTGDLTRVTASPAAGEYRIANTTNSQRGHVIEINSAQWNETISYDCYGKGSVLDADDINDQYDYVESLESLINLNSATEQIFEIYKPVMASVTKPSGGGSTYEFYIRQSSSYQIIISSEIGNTYNLTLLPGKYKILIDSYSGGSDVQLNATGVYGQTDITDTSGYFATV